MTRSLPLLLTCAFAAVAAGCSETRLPTPAMRDAWELDARAAVVERRALRVAASLEQLAPELRGVAEVAARQRWTACELAALRRSLVTARGGR